VEHDVGDAKCVVQIDGESRTRVYPKVYGLSRNKIHAYSNKHSLRSNTKDYDGRTH
jgi:hypothetical protein